MGRCKVSDCNGVTDYDTSAQAVLCTTCGTVVTQDIFTHEDDGEPSASSLYFGPTTLKSLRRIGGALAGQSSKEDKDRRNTTAIHQCIRSLLAKLACPGLAPRAQSLFDQARIRGNYKWGKKAILVAGACIAVVLRESKKGIMISDLASLMDVSPHALCRVFTQITTLLVLQVPAFDHISLLPCLQSHIKALISSPTCSLPQPMVKLIRPLPPAPVLRLATSLGALISGLQEHSIPSPSAPSTACALFLLALEGQAASSLPSYVSLAQELGKRVGARKDLIVGKYRDICKIVEEWMEEVPWISGADHPDNRLSKKRRKASQRNVIAMGLKDVVQFREDIKARKNRDVKVQVTFSLEVSEEEDCTESSLSAEESIVAVARKRRRAKTDSSKSTKSPLLTRTRTARALTRLDMASLSLLSPSHPLAPDNIRVKMKPSTVPEVDYLQTHILTSQKFPSGVPPTRLQRLTAAKGGEAEINDDELFEEGELEGYFRDEADMHNLRDVFGWTEAGNSEYSLEQSLTSSLNNPDWDLDIMAIYGDFGHDKEDHRPDTFDLGEQVLGEWRELSPSFAQDAELEAGDQFDIHGEW